MKNFLFILLILSVNTVMAEGTVENTLSIPEISADGINYSLDLNIHNSNSIVPTFTVDEFNLLSTTNSVDSNYSSTSRIASIRKVNIDGTLYDILLEANDDGTLTLESIKESYDLSWLFMITPDSVTYEEFGSYDGKDVGNHLIMNVNSKIIQYTDRPHRIALDFSGGLTKFANTYSLGDFVTNPPNVIFSGVSETGDRIYTIVETGTPFLSGEQFILPITQVLGDMILPAEGTYLYPILIVDSIVSSITDFITGHLKEACTLSLKAVLAPFIATLSEDPGYAACTELGVEFGVECNAALDLETGGLAAFACTAAGWALKKACQSESPSGVTASGIASDACSNL